MRRELLSGLTLGLTLGAVGFLRIEIWQALHIYNYGEHHVLIADIIFLSLIVYVTMRDTRTDSAMHRHE